MHVLTINYSVTKKARIYWVGQKVFLGFSIIAWKNPNKLFGQSNPIGGKTVSSISGLGKTGQTQVKQ